MFALSKKDAGWILVKPCTSSQQNNHLWLNGTETTLDSMPGLILTGPATVLFPTADASFSNLSEKAVTHKQEQISLACRKGKLLAEINLQMLEFHREELAGGGGLLSCPAPPPFPLPSVPFIFPTKPSWVLLGPCWAGCWGWRGGGLHFEDDSSVYLPGCPSSWAWDWAGGPQRWRTPASQLRTVHRPQFMWVTPSLWTCRLARRLVRPAHCLREVLPCSGRLWDPGQQQMCSDARASSF